MPKTRTTKRRVEWYRVLLIDSLDERKLCRVEIDGVITLRIDGSVVIRDRYFHGNGWFWRKADAIDFAFPGGHAYRSRGANRLLVRTAGPDRQALIYEYERPLLGPAAWYRLHRRDC